jgi:mono/diheme cytochrome c family protein/glucose/arabinose dehydrogenase
MLPPPVAGRSRAAFANVFGTLRARDRLMSLVPRPAEPMIPLLQRLSFAARRDAGCLVAGLVLAGCHASPPAPAPDARTASARPAPSARPNDATPSIPTAVATLPAPDSASAKRGSDVTPVHTAAAEQALFRTAEGYRLELVAAEPLVQDPVAIDFDADGRMYVAEMRGFMPNLQGTGEDRPVGRIVVLEDTDDDGRMDKKTVFLDSLVLPRSIKVLEHGVLVAETPNVWLVRDTNGDLKADSKELVHGDYGTKQSNPEHNANGLLWGIDNWIHNANYGGQFRLGADGKIVFRKTQDEGQWMVSSDEYGRLFRNSNEDPLRADLVPSHYSVRNPNLPSPRGIYEQLTRNVPVWPGHKTPAVNRGYREETLRPADSTLAHYTSAGSPTAYVGDRLPAELRKSVFVTEPAGNLVGRMIIDEDSAGMARARPAYEHSEFITNEDQRFRPVNVATAPDGTMYVVDMYRGIIQHRVFITGYLEQKIIERGMEQPIGLGRIWRVVHSTTRRGERPALSKKSAAELVPVFAHPNGWWRITAQRLLVERGDRSVVPALKERAERAPDWRTRLHALWTLDGLDAIEPSTVTRALDDPSRDVRVSALQLAERWLGDNSGPLKAAVLRKIEDSDWAVRHQLAATIGTLPPADPARETTAVTLLERFGTDPLTVDAVLSGVAGKETVLLDRLLRAADATPQRTAAVTTLAGTLMKGAQDPPVQELLRWVAQEARPAWQRQALLAGIEAAVLGTALPGSAPARRVPPAAAAAASNAPGGRGGAGGARAFPEPGAAPAGGGGGRGRGGTTIALTAEPAAFTALAVGGGELGPRVTSVLARMNWPGKAAAPDAAPQAAPLTPAEQQLLASGQGVYTSLCQACHQEDGRGREKLAPSLVGSALALAGPEIPIRILLNGKEGEVGLMPPLGASLSDEQIAGALTFVRRQWGNSGSAIDPGTVKQVRAQTASRTRPWTNQELLELGTSGRGARP